MSQLHHYKSNTHAASYAHWHWCQQGRSQLGLWEGVLSECALPAFFLAVAAAVCRLLEGRTHVAVELPADVILCLICP